MFLDFWGLTSLVHLSSHCRLPRHSQLKWVSAFCSLSGANLSCGSFLRSITWLSFLVFFLAQVPPDCNKHPFKCGTVFCSLRWVKKKPMPSSVSELDQCFSVWVSFQYWLKVCPVNWVKFPTHCVLDLGSVSLLPTNPSDEELITSLLLCILTFCNCYCIRFECLLSKVKMVSINLAFNGICILRIVTMSFPSLDLDCWHSFLPPPNLFHLYVLWHLIIISLALELHPPCPLPPIRLWALRRQGWSYMYDFPTRSSTVPCVK